ncbi:hypothetical protein PssiTeo3_35320 [Pseudomonas sichuanensis]|nr:hypothetical protein [Pseudomonas sichuanensis]
MCRDAPRGRRSISQALQGLWRAPGGHYQLPISHPATAYDISESETKYFSQAVLGTYPTRLPEGSRYAGTIIRDNFLGSPILVTGRENPTM